MHSCIGLCQKVAQFFRNLWMRIASEGFAGQLLG
jgi:hypothetical protein